MAFLFYFYALCLLLLFAIGWRRYHDPFHPWTFLIPQMIFLYAVMPLAVYHNDPQNFMRYAGDESLLFYQAITFLLSGCLLAGVQLGARGLHPRQTWWRPQIVTNPVLVRRIALACGLVAMAAWLYGIMNVGGFSVAYGQAYGGGWSDSGYLREMPFVGLIGALLIFLLRTGRRMRPLDWVAIFFCVFPILFHGLLGARRGPMFMALVVVVGGYFYFMRMRVSLSLLLPAGIMVGLLMLFLVTNRGDIYLGSELSDGLQNPFDFLVQWDSNEYLIGSAVVRYTQEYGGFYGTRELIHILGRFIPSAVWPSIYSDLPALFGQHIDLTLNAGVDPLAIARVSGWQPSVGSAVGFVGDLWLEYQYLAPFAALLIGIGYGYVWRMARLRIYARFLYPIMAALSVYLIMQDQDAWLYRLILLGAPIILIATFTTALRVVEPRTFAAGPPQPAPMRRPGQARPSRMPREAQREPDG